MTDANDRSAFNAQKEVRTSAPISDVEKKKKKRIYVLILYS